MHLGGVERSLISLLESLPKGSVQVDLFLYDHSGDLLSQIPADVNLLPPSAWYLALCLPLVRVLTSKQFSIGLSRLFAKAIRFMRGLLGLAPGFLLARSYRYAGVFLPKIPGEYDLAISFLKPHDFVISKVRARRKVGWVHTDYTALETGVVIGLEQEAWKKLDRVVAVSSEVGDHFGEVFPEISNRIIVIENILNPGAIRQKALINKINLMEDAKKSGYFCLCTVGRFSYAKGIDLAAEAAAKLRNSGIKFRWYIIGYGDDLPIIQEKINNLGISEEFILLGANENPYPHMLACDLYVQPSRYEGKCVSIREAQILGKAVLVSRYPTVDSQVEHGADGWIVPAGVDGLADGLQIVLQDANLRERLAMCAASRDYSNRQEIQKVLALLPDPIA